MTNKAEWMFAYEARRVTGEDPATALANSYEDVTGESYEEYKATSRMQLECAARVALNRHCSRAGRA